MCLKLSADRGIYAATGTDLLYIQQLVQSEHLWVVSSTPSSNEKLIYVTFNQSINIDNSPSPRFPSLTFLFPAAFPHSQLSLVGRFMYSLYHIMEQCRHIFSSPPLISSHEVFSNSVMNSLEYLKLSIIFPLFTFYGRKTKLFPPSLLSAHLRNSEKSSTRNLLNCGQSQLAIAIRTLLSESQNFKLNTRQIRKARWV